MSDDRVANLLWGVGLVGQMEFLELYIKVKGQFQTVTALLVTIDITDS